MPRLPGDPSLAGWLLFVIDFRLPERNLEVTPRTRPTRLAQSRIARLMVVMIPVCVALAFLPGPAWLRIAVPALALIASVGTVAISADDVRAARLKQHGLEVPDDPDLGAPRTDDRWAPRAVPGAPQCPQAGVTWPAGRRARRGPPSRSR